MAKDVKRRFTVDLEISTGDAEKKVKQTVGNLKAILADFGSASDKFGYLKELADYLSQIDAELDRFAEKHGGEMFARIFGGLDGALRKEMEQTFGVAREQMAKLEAIREKFSQLKIDGPTAEGLKPLEIELKELYDAIGRLDDAKISGRGALETRLDRMQSALDNFAVVFDTVKDKINGGFGFGDVGSGAGSESGGAGGIEQFSDEVKRRIDELEKQVARYQEVKNRLNKMSKVVKDVRKNGSKADIPDSYKTELTVESVQSLITEFDSLSDALKSGDKTSIDYLNNLARMTEVVLTLDKALRDIRADANLHQVFTNTKSGRGDSMLGALSLYASRKQSWAFDKFESTFSGKNIDGVIADLQAKIANIKKNNVPVDGVEVDATKIRKQIDDLEKQVGRYEEIARKFEEIKLARSKYNDEGILPDAYHVEQSVDALQQLVLSFRKAVDAKKQFEQAGDNSSVDYYENLLNIAKMAMQLIGVEGSIDEALEDQLEQKKMGRGTLGGTLSNYTDVADRFLNGSFDKMSQSMEALVTEIKSTLSSLRASLSDAEAQPAHSGQAGAGTTGGGQARTGGGGQAGTGTAGGGQSAGGTGVLTDAAVTSLENTIKSEASALSAKLDNVLKVELVKDDTKDVQGAIDDIRSTIEQIAAVIDGDKAGKDAAAQQSLVDVMKTNLKSMLGMVSEHNAQTNEYGAFTSQELKMMLMSDGTISVGHGEDGKVYGDTKLNTLLSNLSASLIADFHSHPLHRNPDNGNFVYANDHFSGSLGDLNSTRFSQQLGAKLSGMITGNILRTIDISKLSSAQLEKFVNALRRVEDEYAANPAYSDVVWEKNGKLMGMKKPASLEAAHRTTEVFESMMYEAFARAGISKQTVDNDIFKKWNLTDDAQLTELATFLVSLSQAAHNAISPVERLQEIISSIGGDVTSTKARTLFQAFDKGEVSAADVFNGLSGKSWKVNQDTIDSMMKIDAASGTSPMETLLAQISSTLDVISSGVASLDGKIVRGAEDDLGAAIGSVIDFKNAFKNGVTPKGFSSAESIFDPLNVTASKNQDVMNRTDSAVAEFQSALSEASKAARENGVSASEALGVFNKFTKAISYIRDSIQQISLYETRTGETFKYNGTMPALSSMAEYREDITDDGTINQLLSLLSGVRRDVVAEKSGAMSTQQEVGIAGDDKNLIPSLNAIQSILESIYGVLKADTGIEANTKNSVAYKEPVVDTNARERIFSEQDIAVLNSILEAIRGIENYLHSIDHTDDTSKKPDQDANAILDLTNLIRSALSQQYATEGTLQAIKTVLDGIYSRVAQDASKPESDAPSNVEPADNSYALESTLQSVKGVLDSILSALQSDENITNLTAPLLSAVKALENVASGIVQQQKASKSNTSAANARIANKDSYAQIKSIALGALGDRALDSGVTEMKALANGVVQVTGWLKVAEDAWEGFTVQVNEAGEASKLAFSANAKAAKQAAEQAKNEVMFKPEETAQRALEHMRKLNEEGKKATLQYKDSGRYTVSTEEMHGGLSKQTFQTFDVNQPAMSRTTVTLSNAIAAAIKDANTLISENAAQVGNAELLSRYNTEYARLIAMNQTYEAMDDIGEDDMATWNKQIALVQQLGGEVSRLITQQQKLEGQQGVATSAKRLQEYQSNANKMFDGTGIGLTGPKTAEQSGIISVYDEIVQKINDFKKSHTVLTDAQQQELDALIAKLETLTDAYKQAEQAKVAQLAFDAQKTDLTTALNEYKKSITASGVLTSALAKKLIALGPALSSATNTDELKAWEDAFAAVKQEISEFAATMDAMRGDAKDVLDGESKRKDSLEKRIYDLDADSAAKPEVISAVDDYVDAFARLERAEAAVKNAKDLTDAAGQAKLQELEEAKKKCDEYAEALNKVLNIEAKIAKNKATRTLAGLSNGLTKAFKTLDFTVDGTGLTAEQQRIADTYQALIDTIEEYKVKVASGERVDTSDMENRINLLREEIRLYKEANGIVDAKGKPSGKTYGSAQLQNFTARYNSLVAGAGEVGLGADATIVDNLTQAYNRLVAAQDAFNVGEDLTTAAGRAKVDAFKAAQIECGKYARELGRVVNASKKLESEGHDSSPLGDDFSDDLAGRREALRRYVETTYGADVANERFKDNFNQMAFTVRNADGTFSTITASINAARTAIVSMTGETKRSTTGLMSFVSSVGSKFRELWVYTASRLGVDEIIQAVRTGINYVREIDSALTELKKVTNETDATYNQFLQRMSSTAGVVGGTVAELTTMAAEWSRLGYSMEESAQLAESTAILLNVSEFSDATEASKALISTMQAFGYAADESRHVVDILNEVGNNYAISSDGLATALQDSASSLMTAGASLEESVALIAAANKVVQDPNSVGK